MYNFKLTTPEEVIAPARFTYVFTTDKDSKDWRIKTHHSSALLNPVGGEMIVADASSSSTSLRGISLKATTEDWLNLDLLALTDKKTYQFSAISLTRVIRLI